MHQMIEKLELAIKDKDVSLVKSTLSDISKELSKDPNLVNEITTPAIYTNLQNMLVEELGVPPRAMMIKNRVVSRGRRAVMFVMALTNGANKVE